MATTDTQQTAQFAAQAAVSAAEAKQYLLSIEQPVIDISESVADAQNAAAAAEMARDQAQGISTSLVQTIDSQLSEQETQFESQMTTQQSSFESSQSERESAFEEKSNEFESRFSSQLSTQESTFSESQTDKENRFQQFLLSSGYVFLGDYENGPFQFSARNQYIRYDNQYYRLNASTDVGFTTTGTDATSFANDVAHFVMMDGDAAIRANLGSGEEGLGGDLVADTEYFSVRDVLSRMRTLADVGAPLPYLGYDSINDAALYNAMGEASDRHLLLNGGLHLAGDCTNGIRRNAGLFSVRGGQEDSGQGFNVPLMGVSNARGLRGYEIYELVSSYTDVTTPERQAYHNVATATYTATTATIDPTTYAETLAKLKVGHYIRTMHPTYCVGLVTAINAETGVITVDEWADSGTTTTTPASGVGLYTRYITKAYAANINLFITENSDVTNASGVELGMSSHKLVSGTVAGLDIPVLSSSTQNMTVGLLVRAATKNGTGLDFSVRASDARVNFHSDGTDGIGRTVRVGFNESSNAITGFRGNGKNTSYLMLASTVTDVTDISLEHSPMILGPLGQDYRKYDRAITISSDATLNGYFPNITLTAAGITITMPPAAAHRNGHYYYFNLRAAGDYFFKGDVPVEGNTPYKVTTTVERKTIKIQYDGSQWLVFGDK